MCLAIQVEFQAIMGSPSLGSISTDLVPAPLVLYTAPQILFSCFSCFLKKMAQIWSTVIRNTGGVSSHKTLPTRLQPRQQVDTTTLVLTKTIWQLLRRIRNFQARSDGDYNNCKKLWHICKTVDELFIIWLFTKIDPIYEQNIKIKTDYFLFLSSLHLVCWKFSKEFQQQFNL